MKNLQREIAVVLIIALMFIVKGHSSPLGENPNFTHLMLDSSESVGEVLAITQDNKGFIWVAGKTGLARYDGYRFYLYQNNPNDNLSITSNNVSDVYEDSYGVLWATTQGGGAVRLNRKHDNFYRYLHDPEDPRTLASNTLRRIYEDDDRNLWFIGTYGVSLYNRETDDFKQFLTHLDLQNYDFQDLVQISEQEYLIATINEGVILWNRQENTTQRLTPDNTEFSLPHATARVLLKDSENRIWVGHESGLSEYLPGKKNFRHIPLPSKFQDQLIIPIWALVEGADGTLWIGSDGGGVMYHDPTHDEFVTYAPMNSESSLTTSVIRTIFIDRAGDLWLGNFPGGINYFDKSNAYVRTYRGFAHDTNNAVINGVWSFIEDEKGNLYVGSDGAGLYYFDRQKGEFSRKSDSINFATVGTPFAVLSLLEDRHGDLWMGSWAQGVSRLNPTTKKIVNYHSSNTGKLHIPAVNFWDILEDHNGDLWFTTMNSGAIRYNYDEETFTHFTHIPNDPNSLTNNVVWSVFQDSKNRLWFATQSGINLYQPDTDNFKNYRNDSNDPTSISVDAVFSFFEDSSNTIWVATDRGLNRFHEESETFSHITSKDGLASDSVVGILEGNNGDLWISTTGGLTQYNPESGAIRNFTTKNWLQGDSFYRGSYLKLKSGELVFGGINGFSIIDPDEVTSNNFVPPVYITELKIFNETVNANSQGSPLEKDILITDEIELSYKQSMFSLVFTTLNYRVYDDNNYQYMLDGFDNKWLPVTHQNFATFTNLDPGSYTFRVRASNNDGVWSNQEAQLRIRVRSAPWATWWAYTIYILIFLSILLWYVFEQRRKVVHEQAINQKLREVDKLKDDFLANTSHELRTPINGIVGLAQALKDGAEGDLSKPVNENLTMIVKSGQRLATLVNDILDFSKLQKSELQAENEAFELLPLIEDALKIFGTLSNSNSVRLLNNVSNDFPLVLADPEKIKKVIQKLVGNAIKYTEFGKIEISAVEQNNFICLSVSDSGVGIAKENLPKIFESFKQMEDSGIHTKSGTGLGLAVTKYLIELQGGTIDVVSELGKGSTFTVTLPKAPETAVIQKLEGSEDRNHSLQEIEYLSDIDFEPVNNPDGLTQLPHFIPKNQESDQLPIAQVLVVDDEEVNRMVLRHYMLHKNCIVYEARNGMEALDAIDSDMQFDLVLLDIMMPKISGYKVCEEIRKKFSSTELPVIFVTAKAQMSDMLEGFKVGGNDYINKPVVKDELYARADIHLHLLAEKRRIQA